MSGEQAAGDQAGLYNIESRIITVPQPGVPEARAAYSGNPAFTRGAETAHPITSANLSMFSQPNVLEAMEAVYVHSNNGTGEFHLDEIDPQAALAGLKWLRKNMDPNSEVRQEAIKARESIKTTMELQQARREQAFARAVTGGPDPEQVAEAEAKARQESHEAEARQQLDEVLAGATGMMEGVDINIDTVTRLTGMLTSEQTEDGILIKDNKRFIKELRERVGTYMDDPAELLKDFKALIACRAFISMRQVEADAQQLEQRQAETGSEVDGGSDGPFVYGVAKGYLDHAEIGLLQILEKSAYVDFSEEDMDRWFDVLAEEPDEPMYEGAGSTWADFTQQIMAETRVLANSLAVAARKDPYSYIDTLYAFADKGLDPKDRPRFSMTARSIAMCLSDDLACIQLNQAALAAKEGSDVQRKAMDVRLSLWAGGLSPEQIAGSQDVNKLTTAQKNMICTLYPMDSVVSTNLGTMLRHDFTETAIDKAVGDIMLDDGAASRFRTHALSLEGRTSTILGRLAGAHGISRGI